MKILTTLLVVLISIWLLSACGSGDYKLKVEGLGDSGTESGDTTDANDPNDEGDDDSGTEDHRSDGSELNDTTVEGSSLAMCILDNTLHWGNNSFGQSTPPTD